MKESKAVYVTKHKIRDDQKLVYQIYAKHNREYTDRYDTNNFGCQYDSRKDNLFCTCKYISKRSQDMRYFSTVPKQIYAYHGSRSFTDIGVGSVKALQKRRVKRIYLPETDDRGVGSSDLSSFVIRKSKQQKGSYYDHKRTSSKCVGGILEYNTGCVISEKLSPIIQTKSGTTSTKASIDQRHIEIGSNTIDKNVVTTGTQFEIEIKTSEENQEVKTDKETDVFKKAVITVSEQTQKYKYSDEIQSKKISENQSKKISVIQSRKIEKKVKEVEKVYSSDSLVQHVHNLESPSFDKQSRTSIDPMENKLEREYRRMFSTKDRESKQSVDKPIPEFKSASILRRRFEALRKGLVKKEECRKNNAPSSQDSVPSRKDASVTSDPPSLEGRSYTDTKRYSPIQTNIEQDKCKMYTGSYKTGRDSVNLPSDTGSECQGVKGMFKLWGKKFNFEEGTENDKPKATPSRPSTSKPLAIDINKKPHKQESKTSKLNESKKSGRKFFFFKKKSKDRKMESPTQEKERETYKPSGVTAGRCEIRDGLTLKIGNAPPKVEMVHKLSDEGEEIKRRAWLKNFLANRIESKRSVNVRWNNSMYATSSSTVFELMDTIYKNNGVVLKSRSEITTEESSYYRSYTKNKVNFDQKIEAWMMPKTIPDKPKQIPVQIQSNKDIKERNIEVTISDQRWFIEKSRAFANKIEVVLQTNNFNKLSNKISSDYLRIDIPKDFFDVSSSDGSKQNPTSDEEVYKIVEYESDLNTKKALDKGDHASNDIKVIVSVQDSNNIEAKILETVIKRPPMHRDVVIQGSNVNIPKRCDVIGVGIITQRDLRDIRKPILKIQDDLSDDDSDDNQQTNQKKCEFAESYLQEYYRHWTPLGIDLFSWCVSDSHMRSCSEKSVISFHNQGDGSKSCPNICDDYQTSAVVSSCNTSSCSQCAALDDDKKANDSFSSKFFKKFRIPYKAKTDTDIAKRVLPKDSVEVFKRRKIYAASLKSTWACSEDKPVSVPSIESKGAQNTLADCPKCEKSMFKTKEKTKTCKKHVSMPDGEVMELAKLIDNKLEQQVKQQLEEPLEGILAFKGQGGCEACKQKDSKCAKNAVKAKPICKIPQSPSNESCEKIEKPLCSKCSSSSSKESPTGSMENAKPPCDLCLKTPPPACKHCCTSSPSPSNSPSQSSLPSLPPCCARRKAKPNIYGSPSCSPPISPSGSKCPSAQSSRFCLSRPDSNTSSQRKEKRCIKCQKKLPCLEFPNCKLTSSGSSYTLSPGSPLKRSPNVCSPKVSQKNSPRCSPEMTKNNKAKSPNCSPVMKKSNEDKVPHCSPVMKKSNEEKVPHCIPVMKNSNEEKVPHCNPVMKKSSEEKVPHCSPVMKKSNEEKVPHCSPVMKKSSEEKVPNCSPVMKKSKEKKEKKKKPPKTSQCNLPPCNQIKKSPCASDQFPWPLNNQNSAPVSPSCSKTNCNKKDKNKCNKKCSMLPKTSNQSQGSQKSNECPAKQSPCPETQKPRCAETHSQPCPAMPPPPCPATPPSPCPSMPLPPPCPSMPTPPCPDKQKPQLPCKPAPKKNCLSGIFLKLKPSKKKTCSKECLAWETLDNEQGVVRLNSREKITINMKQETPSTEEIRETTRIKVQDDDGNTLYERKDYTCNKSSHRSLLDDMYKDSKVNRVSTPVMLVTNDVTANNQKNQKREVDDYKSDTSLANLIEIQFKMRVTQGDKTTEVRIGNDDEEIRDSNGVTKIPPEVFIVQSQTKEPEPVDTIEDISPKNDINIKIIVKNFRQSIKKKTHKYDDDFTKKISDKFHTVSTGYSDVSTNQIDDNVFSIHRTTIDLASSQEKSKSFVKPSNELISDELTEPINFISSHSTEHQVTYDIEDENAEKSSKKDTLSYDNYDYTNELETKDLDTDQDATLDINTSNECSDIKFNSKEEKKNLLKRVFEKAHTKPKNKENVRQLRDILKIILTDSSDNEEMNIVSNELAKDVTYTSLKPDYFRNTDSMNNYYKIESSLTIEESKETSNTHYPTADNISTISGTSRQEQLQGCVCSRLAESLNCDFKIGCCCKKKSKIDEVISCDLRNEEDMYLLEHEKAEYVDAHTQVSNHLSTKTNSVNISKHSDNCSVQNETHQKSNEDNTSNKEEVKDDTEEHKEDTKEQTEKTVKRAHKTFVPSKNIKECEMMKLNRTTILGISDDDKIVMLSADPVRKTKKKKEKHKSKLFSAADVLQCYETKKAVLEIYAEKTVSQSGEHFVAKLPKFLYERENEIASNYAEIATNNYKSVCRKNVFRMSVKN